ncbi:hypothetical protein Taro_029875 [Colocasia esculenta]|uniref:Uncharacterized protein n=1 Tax=Colocasia esculenta TaxID=4460 RepID=A0A843W1L1_COLES|nr:hypothetical protein [Colocasia esculenta]
MPCVPALADDPSGGFQKGCHACLCQLGLSWLQANCAVSVGGCHASSLFAREVVGRSQRLASERGGLCVPLLAACGGGLVALAVTEFLTLFPMASILRVLSGCLVQTPDCCFCNLFLGAIRGITGEFSSLTLWSVRGAGWFCLWALDLVEFLLLWLVRDWLSLLSLVHEAHPPYSLQVFGSVGGSTTFGGPWRGSERSGRYSGGYLPVGSECELQESVAAVVGCACFECGCYFTHAAVGFVLGLRVYVGVWLRLRDPACGVAFTGAGLLPVNPVEVGIFAQAKQMLVCRVAPLVERCDTGLWLLPALCWLVVNSGLVLSEFFSVGSGGERFVVVLVRLALRTNDALVVLVEVLPEPVVLLPLSAVFSLLAVCLGYVLVRFSQDGSWRFWVEPGCLPVRFRVSRLPWWDFVSPQGREVGFISRALWALPDGSLGAHCCDLLVESSSLGLDCYVQSARLLLVKVVDLDPVCGPVFGQFVVVVRLAVSPMGVLALHCCFLFRVRRKSVVCLLPLLSMGCSGWWCLHMAFGAMSRTVATFVAKAPPLATSRCVFSFVPQLCLEALVTVSVWPSPLVVVGVVP